MPIEMGKRHGNSYTNSTYKKIIVTRNDGECTSPAVMNFRIKNKMIEQVCPDTCDFYDKCLEKSLVRD